MRTGEAKLSPTPHICVPLQIDLQQKITNDFNKNHQ
jgi:hypothetical protein